MSFNFVNCIFLFDVSHNSNVRIIDVVSLNINDVIQHANSHFNLNFEGFIAKISKRETFFFKLPKYEVRKVVDKSITT